jgi:hypothetical protein
MKQTKRSFKNVVLILTLSFLGIFTTNAQHYDYEQYISYGIKGGLNLTTLDGVDGEMRKGFNAGIFIDYPMTTGFSVRSELLYSAQGVKSKDGNSQIKLNYINWPILAKIQATENFYLEAGPQIGFLISGKGGALPSSGYKALDFGAGLGLGIQLSRNIELGARYNLGLTDITKLKTKHKNRAFQFTLGLIF